MNKLNVEIIKLDVENKILAVLDGDYFTICLKRDKIYEKHFTDFAKLCIKPGDVALDFGANLGYHTITMSELVENEGSVYSFEPQRIIFQQLNCNVFLNKLDNVHTYNFAVGDSTSDVFINSPDYHNIRPMYTNIGNTSINVNSIGDTVQQVTLDSLGFERLNFIKMDVQGSELNILKGGRDTILKNTPVIFMEIEEKQLALFNLTSNDLINYTKNLGYNLYRIIINSSETDDYICIPFENTTIDLTKYPYQLIKT